MNRVAIIVPMLGRPHRVVPLVESIRATTTGARILFAVSPHDTAVHQAIDRVGEARIEVATYPRGDYARKINWGYRATTEPLLFTGADDLLFHPGWLEAAIACLTPGIGVVGTNDLGNPRVIAGEHATHFLVTREYADRGTIDTPHQIFHEGYPHEFVDDECVETARVRGAFAMALESHVEHLNPMNRDGAGRPKAPMDPMYAQMGRRMRVGRPLYQARRHLWA